MKRSLDVYFAASTDSGSDRNESSKKSNQESHLECPFCGLKLKPGYLEMHVADRHREVDAPGGAPTPPMKAPAVGKPNASEWAAAGRVDALAALLQASKRRISKITFYLEYVDSKIYPHVIINNEAGREVMTSAWCCSVKLRNLVCHLGSNRTTTLEDSCMLTLVTNMAPAASSPSSATKPISVADISLLKSMIQKGYRRGMTEEVARLSVEMISRCSEELLRRLPIIIIEDGLLHAALPIVVWLMIAQSKGFTAPAVLLSVCIQIFAESCNSQLLDCINFAPKDQTFTALFGEVSKSFDSTGIYICDLPSCARRTLIVSILMRMSYGGTSGDMSLLHVAAICWTHRLFQNMESLVPEAGVNEAEMNAASEMPVYLHPAYVSDVLMAPYGRHCMQTWVNNHNAETQNKVRSIINYPVMKSKLCTGVEDMNSENVLKLRDIELVYLGDFVELLPISNSFVLDGIDFHCDTKLIPHIIRDINGSPILESWMTDNSVVGDVNLESAIKMAIWIFRSSTNTRKLFEGCSLEEQTIIKNYTAEKLLSKVKYAGLWRVICPSIISYSSRKEAELCRTGM